MSFFKCLWIVLKRDACSMIGGYLFECFLALLEVLGMLLVLLEVLGMLLVGTGVGVVDKQL